jgi:hypothetical protein
MRWVWIDNIADVWFFKVARNSQVGNFTVNFFKHLYFALTLFWILLEFCDQF